MVEFRRGISKNTEDFPSDIIPFPIQIRSNPAHVLHGEQKQRTPGQHPEAHHFSINFHPLLRISNRVILDLGLEHITRSNFSTIPLKWHGIRFSFITSSIYNLEHK
jgi:hypothetical protein